MIKFPYGVSNLQDILREGFVFIDKTKYIEILEKNEKYVSFLRPRRIGKSLWVSVLEHYYDINKKHLFKELFSKYYIGQNPTPLVNSFRVLKFDFSGIDTQTDTKSYNGFLRTIKARLFAFMEDYDLFEEAQKRAILDAETPAETMRAFFTTYQRESIKIYLIIDEYDHFTNEILLRDLAEFKTSVSQDGFVRKFYETIKEATQQGIVNRFFITGVSPVTLDSLTSGFNIVTHLTHSQEFHNMVGFTEAEVRYLLNLVLVDKNNEAELMNTLKAWYNGYRFNVNAPETLYNANMVLFFLKNFAPNQTNPKVMLDPNIMPDYGKLKKIFEVANFLGNKQILQDILTNKEIVCEQIYQFNFEQPFGSIAFVNFLFYMGNLTLKGENELGIPVFVIPNYVIGELYWQYYAFLLQEEAQIPYEDEHVKKAIYASAAGDIKPFMLLVQKLLQILSNRDFQRFDEKYIKVVFTAYAMQGNFYHVVLEREIKNLGFMDMEWRKHPARNVQHTQYAFELKYLKKANKAQTKQTLEEAKKQLSSYIQADEELKNCDKLKAIAAVVVKDEVFWEEV